MRITPISNITFTNSQPLKPIYCVKLDDGTEVKMTEPELKEYNKQQEAKKEEKRKEEELKKKQEWLALISKPQTYTSNENKGFQ